MKPTKFSERIMQLSGWPVRITSYRLGEKYFCKADNVEPGACLARSVGASKDEVEQSVISRAQEYLARTRRFSG